MIPVDSARFRPIATGNVSAVAEWSEVDGKRKRTDVQATNDAGLPLWNVEILRQVRSFGEEKTVAMFVEVGSKTLPKIEAFSPVKFENVSVDFYVTRDKQLGQRWSAEEMGEADSSALDEVLSQ